MAAEAKPYKEGNTWSMRCRIYGQELFESGHMTKTAAKEAMAKRVNPLKERGKPKGAGPHRTTVAQAAQDYAVERLRFMKGAVQEANRINKYLRPAGLATLKVTPWAKAVAEGKVADVAPVRDGEGSGPVFFVELVPAKPERDVPRGLGKHREKLAKATAESDEQRARIACMPMAKVQRHHMQALIYALRDDGLGAATIQNERAFVRSLFYNAQEQWCWNEPTENPAAGLKMPKVDNARERVMSAEEQQRLDEAIQDCRNNLVGPTLKLLRETAMRASEPLEHARWCDVDWERKVLKLTDAKAGKREVPLSSAALQALKELQALNPSGPDNKIVHVSYEALKAAWKRACERAEVEDLRLQDLRHTAATRMALASGNVFLVRALTGHKTMAMLERYVNVKAGDVVKFMEAQAAKEQAATEGAAAEQAAAEVAATEQAAAEQASAVSVDAPVDEPLPANVVRWNFGLRRKA